MLLSPDHAVFVDGDGEIPAPGVLIPIRYLINAATVRQRRVAAVSYWHVELPAHGVILADGLSRGRGVTWWTPAIARRSRTAAAR